MSNIIDLWEWKRTRPGKDTRARPARRRRENGGFVRIGDVSSAIVRRLRE
jgi:hypothetical protein